MMAILRYMDDLCLETTATLLYCVRTGGDIMFESEVEKPPTPCPPVGPSHHRHRPLRQNIAGGL